MKRLPSIHRRLSRLLVGVVLVWGLAVSAVVWLALASEVQELLDDTLRASADALSTLLVQGFVAPPSAGATVTAVLPETSAQPRFAWQLVGPGAQVRLRSPGAPAEPWIPLASSGFADIGDGWRIYGQRLGDGMLYVAQTGAERREAQAELALVAVLAALGVSLLAGAWLRRRIRHELQPLVDTADAVQAYEPLAPQARLMAPSRAETAPIHDAIEDLGHRLALRVANERAFTAHAAHALRTPLAGIDAQLALAQLDSPPAVATRIERARQAAARLTRVVGALLALFRSGVDVQWQPIDLAQLMARLPPADGLEVRVVAPGRLRADPDLLTGALLNLIDNAVRHGARHLWLEVKGAAGGAVTLVLQDDGPGIAADRRARMQSALEAQTYEGAMGLGLMLADLVARAHGGTLRLADVQQGCRIEIDFAPPAQTSPSGSA